MRKQTAITALLLVTITTVSAHAFEMDMLYEENTDHLTEETNMYIEEVPSFLGSLIGDQTINARINSENQTREVGVKMNGTMIQEIKMDTFENATLEVNTSEKQLANITGSETPIETLNTKLKNGDIEYSSEGAINSLRTIIAEQLLTLTSLI